MNLAAYGQEMESRSMSGIETSGAIGLAAAKLAGAKVALGMAGAALLYLFMPPERPDGSFNRREFAARMAVAGFFSLLLGDWFVDAVNGLVPALKAPAHPAPFWLACGAPGWWVSRAAALWLYKRRDKDVGEIVREIHP